MCQQTMDEIVKSKLVTRTVLLMNQNVLIIYIHHILLHLCIVSSFTFVSLSVSLLMIVQMY